MRIFRAVMLSVVFYLCIAFLPASAAPNLTVGIHYWTEVHQRMGQSYNVKLIGDESGAYVILALHPDTNIYAINHSEGVQCAEMDVTGKVVFCYVEHLKGAVTMAAHGTVTGPGGTMHGRGGVYGVLRVGTLEDGSPGRGWILDAKYSGSGTIPSVLAPGPEPTNYKMYLPGVNGQ